ncbi:MAG: iron ABC transporter permease [Firmicutes bacterium]|nr:iron ABC transporter permease [Bacillota bacterium]
MLTEHQALYRKNKRKARSINLSLLLLLIIGFCFALFVGKYRLDPVEVFQMLWYKLWGIEGSWDQMSENVVFGLRLPRILASIVCGAALAMSGASYQAVFKNPLVSPDFLGVSSGACIGAAVAILMTLSSAYIQAFAFIGGLIAVMLTLMIPFLMRSESNIMLVLSGIIVGGVMGSILGFIKYIADPETELATITYWQMGSFSYVTLEQLLKILPALVIAAVLLLALSWRIDIVSLGENEAKTLGANVKLIRTMSIIFATLLTASSVCIAGTIGWVGLVIPHFGRMLIGPDNRHLLPASCLLGGLFLLVVDTVTRTIGPAEMPISILTGIIGAPFYAWLLYKQRGKIR